MKMILQTAVLCGLMVPVCFARDVDQTQAITDESPSSEELLRQAVLLAQSVKTEFPGIDPPAEKVREIRELVAASFDARQKEQKDELERLRTQLKVADDRIQQRQQLRDRIIDRKTKDLFSAAPANWESPTSPMVESEQSLVPYSELLEELRPTDPLEANDVIAVYIPGVLPFFKKGEPPEPPVNTTPRGLSYEGFPMKVQIDGKLSLPLLEPIEVAGLTTIEAQQKISKQYVVKDILRPNRASTTITILERANPAKDKSSGLTATPLQPGDAARGSEDLYDKVLRANVLIRRIADWLDSTPGKPLSPESLASLQNDVTRRSVRETVLELSLQKQAIDHQVELASIAYGAAEKGLKNAERAWELGNDSFNMGDLDGLEVSELRNKREEAEAVVWTARARASEMRRVQKAWQKVVGTWLGKLELALAKR